MDHLICCHLQHRTAVVQCILLGALGITNVTGAPGTAASCVTKPPTPSQSCPCATDSMKIWVLVVYFAGCITRGLESASLVNKKKKHLAT